MAFVFLSSFQIIARLIIIVAPLLVGCLFYTPRSVLVGNFLLLTGVSIVFLFPIKHPTKQLIKQSIMLFMIFAISLVVACDLASYKVKGVSADYYFWKLFSFKTIFIHFKSFPIITFLGCLIVLIPVVSCFIFWNNQRGVKSSKILLWFGVVCVLCSFRIENSIFHIFESYQSQARVSSYLKKLHTPAHDWIRREQINTTQGNNILWIYLESFNNSFFDHTLFPSLMPYLSKISQSGLRLTSLSQVPGQQYSIGGISSSQCGRYELGQLETNQNVCLGHILHDAGYVQVFMQGASGDFENFQSTFKNWNFDSIIDKEEFDSHSEYQSKRGGWGYYDSALFDLAYVKFKALAQQEKPFYMVLFTQDTHDGDYDLDTCRKITAPYTGLGSDNHMVQAAHCADALVYHFLQKISVLPAYQNTTVVLVGDHIMHEKLVYFNDSKDQDKIWGLILNSAQKGEIESHSTHADLAPTVLTAAKIKTNAQFLDGHNLITHEPALREVDFNQFPRHILIDLGFNELKRGSVSKEDEIGVIYKHHAQEIRKYVADKKMPYTEHEHVKTYFFDTKSFNWRNMMVFIESHQCELISAQPKIKLITETAGKRKIDFPYKESSMFKEEDSCFRLLSFYMPANSIVTSLDLMLTQDKKTIWSTSIHVSN